MTLNEVAEEGKEYVIRDVRTEDDELRAFLLSLGCYPGEEIGVISKKRSGLVVALKDGRYNIDRLLSAAIEVC